MLCASVLQGLDAAPAFLKVSLTLPHHEREPRSRVTPPTIHPTREGKPHPRRRPHRAAGEPRAPLSPRFPPAAPPARRPGQIPVGPPGRAPDGNPPGPEATVLSAGRGSRGP